MNEELIADYENFVRNGEGYVVYWNEQIEKLAEAVQNTRNLSKIKECFIRLEECFKELEAVKLHVERCRERLLQLQRED